MGKKREYYFDNAKFILILLVVFGHFIQPFIHENKWIMTIYHFVYSFHMPAFILVAGYFAKGFKKEGYIKKTAKKLLIPYLIFQLIYTIYYYFLYSGERILFEPFNPQWSLWFLISLFCWNLMLYVYTKLPIKWSISIAVLVGIAVGYLPFINNYMSLSRTFVFFPLFLVGYFIKREHFSFVKRQSIQVGSWILLLGIFIAYYFIPEFNTGWLLGSKPYESLTEENIGGIIRLGIYFVSFLTTFSFFSILPERQFFFTNWGTHTLYVYLLHGFVIKYFRNSELLDVIKDTGSFSILIFATLVLTIFLSTTIIRAISQPLVELRISIIKKSILSFFNFKQRGFRY
ncbi:acyltransferase family protein [Fredinandcohnia sp. 179-A 10B2 NHS]|uniref:acyltransferase family protein n=1 Tax=Fredinandcohnia sp. 179-A 10B2 NHS TaxID=3235176 RepID=UPI00399F9FD0